MFAEHVHQKPMSIKRRKPEKFIFNYLWLSTPILCLRAKLVFNLKRQQDSEVIKLYYPSRC